MRLLLVLLLVAPLVAEAQAPPAGGTGARLLEQPGDLRVRLAALGVALPGVSAAGSTGDWSPVGDVNPEAFDGTIYAAAGLPDGRIVVGGSFTTVYGVAATGLAAYDPATETWSALGGGVESGSLAPPVVYALVVAGGRLYLGGDFDTAGGIAVPNVAAYDPATGAFSALGTSPWSVTAAVRALAGIPGGSVLIGGQGTASNAGGLMRYTPSTGAWLDLGAALPASRSVQALAVDPANGRVWVGGDFSTIAGIDTGHLASYTFATGAWTPVTGIPTSGATTGGGVRALALGADGRLYVGGAFNGAGTVSDRLAIYDTGTGAWSGAGDLVGDVKTLALTNGGTLYVGGLISQVSLSPDPLRTVNLAAYQTTTGAWTAPGSVRAPVRALAATGSGLVVAGDGRQVQLWTSSGWTFTGPTRFDGTIYETLEAPGGTVYAAGDFTTTPDGSAVGIAAFDGTAWQALGAGLAEPLTGTQVSVQALTLGPDGRLYVGGNFGRAGGLAVRGFAVWDGTVWTDLGGGLAPFVVPPFQPLVTALTFAPDGTLYVGLTATLSGTVGVPLVLAWDGTAWSVVGDMDRAGALLSLFPASDGTLYAAGSFYDGGPLTPTGLPFGLLAFDGTDWVRADDGLSGPAGVAVFDLAELPDGRLVAAGQFGEAGGQPASVVAAWDGATWSGLNENLVQDPGLAGLDLHLATGGTLYLGGLFAGIDGTVLFAGVARLDAGDDEWRAVEGLSYATYTTAGVFAIRARPGGGLLVAGVDAVFDGLALDGVLRSEPGPPQASTLDVRVFLQGAYPAAPTADGQPDAMRTDLRDAGFVPLAQPYAASAYDGTAADHDGAETVSPAVLAAVDVVDWVVVGLRTSPSGADDYRRAALLLADGRVRDTDGTSGVLFLTTPGAYHVAVYHRNHLPVMSATAHVLGSMTTVPLYRSGHLYGGASAAALLEQNGTGTPRLYGLVAGDGTSDGAVMTNDRQAVWQPAVGATGYLRADFSLDGEVLADDRQRFWLPNAGRATALPGALRPEPETANR